MAQATKLILADQHYYNNTNMHISPEKALDHIKAKVRNNYATYLHKKCCKTCPKANTLEANTFVCIGQVISVDKLGL